MSEERKTRGLIGFAVMFLVLAYAVMVFMDYQPNVQPRSDFEKEIQEVVNNGGEKDETVIISELMDLVDAYELPVESSDIELNMGRDEFSNRTVEVRIPYSITVDFMFTTQEFNRDIKYKNVLIIP